MVPSGDPRSVVGAGRFAPTPTGRLHLGNARTALLAWLAARSAGLRNILRIEDLDPKAIPAGCLEGQYADLDWLGLVYDESPQVGGHVGPYRQSERFHLYDGALAQLDALGVLYPCWCSRKEIQMAAVAPHASDEGPIYPGTCRPKTPQPLGALTDLPMRRDRKPALRLHVHAAMARLGVAQLTFEDRVAGHQSWDLMTAMGDFVVRRVDGVAAYQVACSWDDVAMGCSQVLRGADLLHSTARQCLIIDLLRLPRPTYSHVGLVVGADGARLAKRDGAIALSELRSRGVTASAVLSCLARLSGLPDTADLDHLTNAFKMSRLSTGDVPLIEHLG